MRVVRNLFGFGVAAGFAMAAIYPAVAGEVNGKGEHTQGPVHAVSPCSYSGLNDDPEEAFPFGGRTQTFGQLVNKGIFMPSQMDPKVEGLHPGWSCNGDHGTFEG